MEIGAALAANLGLLTDALDDPDVDVAATLRLMARDVRTAVHSYVGLSLMSGGEGRDMGFTVFEHGSDSTSIVSSMLLPLLRSDDGTTGAGVRLVLYAQRAGAFTDLAADLAWLTGQELTAFAIDRHLAVPGEDATLSALREESTINQAIGVLIGRGYALAEAQRELDVRAAAAGSTRYRAADLILTSLPDRDLGPSESGPA